MRERRKYVRSDGLVLANYRIPELQMEGKSSAYDVSGAGVRITVDKKLNSGALVEMEIYLPGDSRPIVAKGEVIWAQKCKKKTAVSLTPEKEYFYAGIKFTVIDENNRNRIDQYTNRKVHQAKKKI